MRGELIKLTYDLGACAQLFAMDGNNLSVLLFEGLKLLNYIYYVDEEGYNRTKKRRSSLTLLARRAYISARNYFLPQRRAYTYICTRNDEHVIAAFAYISKF